MRSGIFAIVLILSSFFYATTLNAQHSVARVWNDVLLESIRKDFARPTVHARNLHHVSIASYDAWAAFDTTATPYMLGNTVSGFGCPINNLPAPTNVQTAREEAISYAAYRIIRYRFQNAPGKTFIYHLMDSVFIDLGFDTNIVSVDYVNDGSAALGNYIAQCIISFGQQDGSNEAGAYENLHYQPVNATLLPVVPGNANITDPNRWQPLSLDTYIDQSGNTIANSTPGFLSPEWGDVIPFALKETDKTTYSRNGNDYNVYLDPGPPPYIDTANGGTMTEAYKWGFLLVSIWSSHLDTIDNVLWDISPASIGNIQNYPTSVTDYPNFYDLLNGGDISPGHALNPSTGMPYAPQMVRRGDYGRVLAEFWADGPDSETPPGHWFTLLNYVSDHPQLQKRWRGQGAVLSDLEWDVKTYFAMGGAMHDAAIAAWGIKGWYDYLRPISAIRYMAAQGQSSDTSLSNYSKNGIPLIPGYIEVVGIGDPLAANGNIGKIKVYAWRGPDYISNPATDDAGVGWILADNWWPYQRPTFVTPPFAGYISGHSTYSRAAAEVMTMMTGDAFFPGGMGEFVASRNQFLVFEEGPSQTVTLQWATYRDASDQCSLSRIWGGIHPPADDIPGRLIGIEIGPETVYKAEEYFGVPDMRPAEILSVTINDVLITDADTGLANFAITVMFDEIMDTTVQPSFTFPVEDPSNTIMINADSSYWLNNSTFVGAFDVLNTNEEIFDIDVTISLAKDIAGNNNEVFTVTDTFNISTLNLRVINLTASTLTITPAVLGSATFTITATYDQMPDTNTIPLISFPVENPMINTLSLNNSASGWLSPTSYAFVFNVANSNELLSDIDVTVSGAIDLVGNTQAIYNNPNFFSINLKKPIVQSITPSVAVVADTSVGALTFAITLVFDEDMNQSIAPSLNFVSDNPLINTLSPDAGNTGWTSATLYTYTYNVTDANETLEKIDIRISNAEDMAGNILSPYLGSNVFTVDTRNPTLVSLTTNFSTITNNDIGSATFKLNLTYDKDMNLLQAPVITFPNENPLANSLSYNIFNSSWVNSKTFVASYNVNNTPETLLNIDVNVDNCADYALNEQLTFTDSDLFSILIENTTTGIDNNGKPLFVKMHPNPTTGSVTVELPGTFNNAKFQVCNLLGEEIFVRPLTQNSTNIILKDVSTGVYVYKIFVEHKVVDADKLVVK